MQFIDLAAQQDRIRDKLEEKIKSVLAHGKYIMGPEVAEIEKRLAGFVGTKHAISCSSGTDALLLALLAKRVGPGDAIFTSPFTFIATAEVISLLGATPVFVDIDPNTFNMDPKHLQKAISALEKQDPVIYPLPAKDTQAPLKPKGIIAVDIFGLPADYGEIEKIAAFADLFVIEDAAQSLGAEYAGRKACAFGDIACTSFFPAKPLGCYGDGGMCFSDDDGLAEVMLSLRVHGKGSHKYDNSRIGINGRLDTLQAAVLLAKLEIFPDEIERRQAVAGTYSEALAESGLKVPAVPKGSKSAWAQYSILAEAEAKREELQARLKESDIPTAVYYPTPLHLQTVFAHLKYQSGNFPVSEYTSSRVFSLPMHPYLKADDQMKIAKILGGI
ncbi:MAG: DegT/DnrJ/EryC1/StrS family aminotransferase [Desulfobacterales bacterium]|jgi:dTDP-4-amino-4,6-dideoxygalactose transaminase